MRRLALLLSLLATLSLAPLGAQSNPSWWNLASPQATALVGIRWENIQGSVFAEAVGAELSNTGSFRIPGLPCLKQARQILISSPALLAIANGDFPPEMVRKQAAAAGLKTGRYRDIELWIAPGQSTLSLAQLDQQLLLIGARKTLEDAIDRSLAETGRRYSPLLARAARYSSSKDLWVVATRLPDPLASVFVPLDVEARNFEGAVSLRDGLDVEASVDAGSEEAADAMAEQLRGMAPSLPAIARGLQVTVETSMVLLDLSVDRKQLAAAVRQPATDSSSPAPTPAPPQPAGPQVIRIFGLDDGPREIVLAPATGPSR